MKKKSNGVGWILVCVAAVGSCPLFMLLFVFAFDAVALGGQFHDNPPYVKLTEEDKRALLEFRLTSVMLARVESFNFAAQELLKRDDAFRAEWEREDNSAQRNEKSVIEVACRHIQSRPRVEGLLRSQKISVNEYVLSAYTIMFCNWVTPEDPTSIIPKVAYLPHENVEFFIQNKDRAMAILKQTPSM